MKITVGICGASGSIYAVRLLKALLEQDIEVHVIISEAGKMVLAHETEYKQGSIESFLKNQDIIFHPKALLIEHQPKNLFGQPASGSFKHGGMVIAPCSMKTLAAISAGLGDNLMHRSADVCLKEKRPLILLPRETPLSTIHLKNMLIAARAGATILPPSPAFYFNPVNINDLIDFIVARVLDHLKIKHNLIKEWSQ
ncbi:Flavin prenyltransferase UbiX [Candidatus Magnetomoraceae bacterium gMMP-15]